MKPQDLVVQHPTSNYYLGEDSNPILVGGKVTRCCKYGEECEVEWSNGIWNTCYDRLIRYEPRKQSKV